MKRLVLTATALAVLAVPAAAPAKTADKNLVQTAQSAGQFKTLVKLVKAAGLAPTLSAQREVHRVRPHRRRLPEGPEGDPDRARPGQGEAQGGPALPRGPGQGHREEGPQAQVRQDGEGSRVRIRVRGGKVYVNSARVTKVDVQASNGVIHVINRVLIPKDL